MEWEAVDGAAFYLVEIESGGTIIYSIRTEDAFLPLFLTPGDYNIRISIFNKFEKMASRSEWKPLKVFASPQPIIDSAEPDFFYNDRDSISITIGGRDFDARCEFLLGNGADRITGREISRALKGELVTCEVTFSDPRLPEIGIWDLLVKNPSGKEFIRDGAVRFGPRSIPVIGEMKPNTLYKGTNPGRILISGQNFSPRAQIRFEGPSEVPFRNPEIYYGDEITLYLDQESMSPGIYWVSVENEGGLISEPYSFTLEEEQESREEFVRLKREGSSPFLGVAYHSSFPTDGDSSDLYEKSFLGLSLRLREKFRNDSIYAIPVLRETGFAVGLHYTSYSDAIADFLTISQFHLDGGLFYLSDWDSFLNLYLFMGFGTSYSLFFFEDERINHSFDFSDRLETGCQFESGGLKYELGFSFVVTHFYRNTFTALNPYFMVGWNG